MVENKKRNLGWKRSLPDIRDFKLAQHYKGKVVIPVKTDLRPYCADIEDQLNLGACTSFGGVAALEILENLTRKKEDFEDLSHLFVYYFSRLLDGDSVYEDTGCTVRSTVKALCKYGACREDILPYNTKKFTRKPSLKCQRDAKKHIVEAYYSVRTIQDIKLALALKSPVIFGAMLYESFENVGSDGYIKTPTADENAIGGHCMIIVGHDDERQVFIVRNSWSKDFGEGGYVYMDYSYIGNPDLCADFYVISKAKFA